jgi:hypothetical protein
MSLLIGCYAPLCYIEIYFKDGNSVTYKQVDGYDWRFSGAEGFGGTGIYLNVFNRTKNIDIFYPYTNINKFIEYGPIGFGE